MKISNHAIFLYYELKLCLITNIKVLFPFLEFMLTHYCTSWFEGVPLTPFTCNTSHNSCLFCLNLFLNPLKFFS